MLSGVRGARPQQVVNYTAHWAGMGRVRQESIFQMSLRCFCKILGIIIVRPASPEIITGISLWPKLINVDIFHKSLNCNF